MKKSIISFIESLKVNQKLSSFDQASTKQAIVMKLLSLVEWDVFDVDEVKPNYSSKNQQVDFVLRVKNSNQIFITVKKVGEPMKDHPLKLLDFANKEHVGLTIVTNGLVWWFYLSTGADHLDLRRFCVLDLVKQPSEQVALKLIDILQKENIANNTSLQTAEALFQKQQQKIVEDVLPEAWKKIVSEPHGELVQLVKGMVEKLSGQKADPKIVINFLKEKAEPVPAAKVPAPTAPTAPVKAKPAPPPREEVAKSASSFTFKGNTCSVSSWPDLLAKLCEMLRSRFDKDIEKLLWQQIAGRNYFFQNPSEVNHPVKIPGISIYIEGQLSPGEVFRLIQAVLTTFGFSSKDLTIDTNG